MQFSMFNTTRSSKSTQKISKFKDERIAGAGINFITEVKPKKHIFTALFG